MNKEDINKAVSLSKKLEGVKSNLQHLIEFNNAADKSTEGFKITSGYESWGFSHSMEETRLHLNLDSDMFESLLGILEGEYRNEIGKLEIELERL